MKRKVILFIAMSLDGYIATENDNLDWLFRVEGEGDNGYSEMMDTVDTIVMGRKTYDWLMAHENGKFPYTHETCYVYSKSASTYLGVNHVPEGGASFGTAVPPNVIFTDLEPSQLLGRLREMAGKNIWLVGGGQLIQTFIQENLIDDYMIGIAPTLLGKGIPLFLGNNSELDLKLEGIKRYNQFVMLHYTNKK